MRVSQLFGGSQAYYCLDLPSISGERKKITFRIHNMMMGPMPDTHQFLKSTLRAGVMALAFGFATLPVANAQTVDPKDDKVIAIVNGYEIRVSEVRMAMDDIVGQLPDLPQPHRGDVEACHLDPHRDTAAHLLYLPHG